MEGRIGLQTAHHQRRLSAPGKPPILRTDKDALQVTGVLGGCDGHGTDVECEDNAAAADGSLGCPPRFPPFRPMVRTSLSQQGRTVFHIMKFVIMKS